MKYIRFRIREYRDHHEDDATKATSHRKVGTFGYQEIDDRGMVVAFTDENGNAFAAGAVLGYEIIDANAPVPAWGKPDKK